MKAIRVAAIASMLAILAAQGAAASLYVNEPFAYPDGNLVGNGGWTAHSGAGSMPVQVLAGHAVVAQGAGSREDVNTPLGITAGAGNILYSAFDVSVSGASPTLVNSMFAHFMVNSSIFNTRIWTVEAPDGRDYGIGFGSNSSSTFSGSVWANGFNYGQSFRILSSYNFDTGESRMWINPTSPADTFLSFAGVVGDDVVAYGLRQTGGDTSQNIDNLCVANDFNEALTCTPEPGSLALFGLGVLALARRRR